MKPTDWRRLNEAAGVLMTTRGLDPTRATLEAARQLGFLSFTVGRSAHHTDPGGRITVEALMDLFGEPALLRSRYPAEVDAIVAYLQGNTPAAITGGAGR